MKHRAIFLLVLIIVSFLAFCGDVRAYERIPFSSQYPPTVAEADSKALSYTASQDDDRGDVLQAGVGESIIDWLGTHILAPTLWTWVKQLGFAIIDFGNLLLWGETDDPDVSLAYEDRGGALAFAGRTLVGIYENPPQIGTLQYLASLNPFRTETAYAWTPAASMGGYLTNVLPLWKIVRNIAYVLMTVVLVAVGFMIMFRAKTDPYTTVSLQMILPKIVIILVLITFSFAISGLIMDIGELLIQVVGSLFTQLPGVAGPYTPRGINYSDITEYLQTPNPTIYLGGGLQSYVEGLINLVVGFVLFLAKLTLIISLVIKYATVYFMTILSPLAFLLGIIPARQNAAFSWFKSFFACVLAFPATYAVLNIGYYFKAQLDAGLVVSLRGPDVLGGANLAGLLIIATVFIASKVPAMIEDALGTAPPAHVARAGAEPMALARKVPFIGSFL